MRIYILVGHAIRDEVRYDAFAFAGHFVYIDKEPKVIQDGG